MKRTLLTILIALTALGALTAETLVTLDMKLLQSVNRTAPASDWNFTGVGTADLAIKSTGNRNVKGELSLSYIPLDGLPPGLSLITLDKASIKVQFPSLRLTMGKTRIGWGEGYVFNSGDVLYGSLSPSVDLTADEARSDTALLTLARVSLGRSYAEAIVIAPSPTYDPATSTFTPAGITETSLGGRLVTRILGLDVEAGYVKKGQAQTAGDITGHRPYLSFHGYGWLDWYGAGSLAVPLKNAHWENNVRETLNLSLGAFRQFGLGYDGTLSVRLEALVYPYRHWQEKAVLAADEGYGLYLYPELNIGIGRNLNLPVMAIVSPVEQSAQITAGLGWSVYQGFSFLAYAVTGLGEAKDTFHTGDMNFMAGMQFKY